MKDWKKIKLLQERHELVEDGSSVLGPVLGTGIWYSQNRFYLYIVPILTKLTVREQDTRVTEV